jgi:hypothetical protein
VSLIAASAVQPILPYPRVQYIAPSADIFLRRSRFSSEASLHRREVGGAGRSSRAKPLRCCRLSPRNSRK